MVNPNKHLIPSMLVIVLFILLFPYCAPFPKTPDIETLSSPSAYVKRGMTYFQNKDFERATAYFKKAIETDMRYQPAHSYLALSYAHLGEKEEAIEEFRKVVEISPNSTDGNNAQKWLKRLCENPTAIGVVGFHFAKRFKVWEGPLPYGTKNITYQGLATEELINRLEKSGMYKVDNLSDVTYSHVGSKYSEKPPSALDLGKLIHLASRNGAQLLLIPRIDYITVSGQPPSRKGKVVSPGIVFSGEVTMSVAVYSCRSKKLITTFTKSSSKIPFLYGAASYVGGIQGLFKTCSEEVEKELLKHVL